MRDLCKNCGKIRGNHQFRTENCPFGRKTRAGYVNFNPNQKFFPKDLIALDLPENTKTRENIGDLHSKGS